MDRGNKRICIKIPKCPQFISKKKTRQNPIGKNVNFERELNDLEEHLEHIDSKLAILLQRWLVHAVHVIAGSLVG